MEVSGHVHVPAALSPGKDPPVPIGCEAGWVPELVWTLPSSEKSCAAWNQTAALQSLTRCYTDWAN
jgi:hypothetical protein